MINKGCRTRYGAIFETSLKISKFFPMMERVFKKTYSLVFLRIKVIAKK